MIAQTLQWLAAEASMLAALAVAVTLVLGRGRLALLLMLLLAWLHGPHAQAVEAGSLTTLLIAALAMLREPNWRSPQAWLAGLACVWLAGWLPWPSALGGLWPQAPAGSVAAWCLGLALFAALVRWIRNGGPFDLVFALSLLPALPLLLGGESLRPGWLALLACLVLLGGLWAAVRVAYVDALTGLPNRRAFDEQMSRLSGQAAVAMIDVDHFKRFNDRHGHEAGDRALRAVARQVRRVHGGRAYRYGGEEFAVIFEGRRVDQAEEALERVRERVEITPVRVGPLKRAGAQAVRRGQGGELKVTVSMGLALRLSRGRPAVEVLKEADRALYRSKQGGRNRLTLARA
jgi:diguanylate cyclase (GGDEF)-like protein